MNNFSKKQLGMYNEEVKTKFLIEQYPNEESRKILAYLFYNSRPTEEQLDKDLFNFNIQDISKLLKDLNPKNESSARSNGSVISAYLNWAIENGYRIVVDNPLHGISASFYEGFIGEKKLYISKEKIEQIVENVENAQDAVIIQLLFEGASGTKMSELLNLQKEDIDWENNVLKLKDDKYGEREIKHVSEKCLRLLRQAINEVIYKSKNGTVDNHKAENELVKNNYILRNIKVGAYSTGKGKSNLVYRRMDMINEFVDTGLESFTTKAISRSGMIYEGYKLFLEEGQLGSSQLGKIAEKFGVRKIKVNGYEYYNITNLSKFINRENILELYGKDIQHKVNTIEI